MPEPFKVCWDRISRAKAHSKRIAQLWNEFSSDEDSYLPHVSVDDNGAGVISISAAPIPDEIPFTFGEFLYQLRAALDACIYEIACLKSGQRPPPDENTLEFPFCQPGKFKGSSWKIRPLSDEQRAIVEAVQPYNTPTDLPDELLVANWNRSLGILNDWARQDRHRKLHVVAAWASKIEPLLRNPPGTSVAYFFVCNDTFITEDEHVVAEFGLTGWTRGMEIHANPNLFLDIAVAETPPPCHNTDTFGNRLISMEKAVEVVVDSLASHCGIAPRNGTVIRPKP